MPDRVEPGQKWALWVFDDGLNEKLEVERVENGCVYGKTQDGTPFVVGEKRLLNEGEPLKEN